MLLVELGVYSLLHVSLCYVAHTVFEMEASHPEAVAEMLALTAAMFPIGADGKATSARSGLRNGVLGPKPADAALEYF